MKRILVIEDNTQVRENICEILELSGYQAIGAENGKIGVESAKSDQPDLILCDVMMPELDGFGVLKILNRDQGTFDIPFIFLTAKAEKEDFRRGMGLGADDYITKPFDDVELLDAIDIRLKKSERIEKSFERSPHGLTRFISQAKAQKELIKLSEEREIRSYQKNDNIYSEGGMPRWLYYIRQGTHYTCLF
jgi:CheY-like chemotaxis protein